MSLKLDGPFQTQRAVVLLNGPHGNERAEAKPTSSSPAGRRRVFVQTETGCVLGMELDRRDNAHTVKRRMQLVLNIPTDESSLTFGDMILNDDLSAVRKDSPLLLTRNHMHRSSSTPCLSPNGKALQQRDNSGLVEILCCSNLFADVKVLIKEIVKAIKKGVDPIPVNSGLGGAYFFRNLRGECIAIVKPTDEEPFGPNNPKGFLGKALGQPGLKCSVRIGETGFREVAAYLLDYESFANVPPTALVKITHSIFNVNDTVNGNKLQNKVVVSKIASLQQFIPHDFDAGNYGTSTFPVTAVHGIGILDVRILNTDRHAGNILVRKLDNNVGRFSHVELVPIDHGLCLPESLEDPYFEWIHWPQASIPFSDDELEYIENLDPFNDSRMLRTELPMIREACLRILVLCTIFLKEAAAFGLCLSEIGEMMSREFRVCEEEPSELEVVCMEVKRIIAERELLCMEADLTDGQVLFDMDFEDAEMHSSPRVPADLCQKGWNPLSKLEESIQEEELEVDDELSSVDNYEVHQNQNHFPTVSKLSISLQKIYLSERDLPQNRRNPDLHLVGTRGSAKELLPAMTSFVKLADMNEEEWILFLEKFQERLYPAFCNRKSLTNSQRQKQRLGSSCQF